TFSLYLRRKRRSFTERTITGHEMYSSAHQMEPLIISHSSNNFIVSGGGKPGFCEASLRPCELLFHGGEVRLQAT
ncbi:hypothetical protein, partial [Ferrovum myxofaciens]|uniref:hypothetical protein n=1 Tax=Ferrovum myxofaciens TaxID=416213 RepID=UPI001D0D20CF